MKRFILLLLTLTGCYQGSTDDSDLRTIPTTNNPRIIPNQSGLPGIPM